MNFLHRIGPAVLLTLGVHPFVPQAFSADCACAPMIERGVRCYRSIWSHFVGANPENQDQLETLLEAMWEGEPNGKRIETADCPEEPDEGCEEACQLEIWSSFVNLARTPSTPQETWGAATLAFGAYMDIDAPPEVVSELERLATELLAKPRDRVATATVLRVMKYYDFTSPSLMSKLLTFMANEDPLIRSLAFQRFSGFTDCDLKFDAGASERKRTRQLRKLHNWWNMQQANATSETAPD